MSCVGEESAPWFGRKKRLLGRFSKGWVDWHGALYRPRDWHLEELMIMS